MKLRRFANQSLREDDREALGLVAGENASRELCVVDRIADYSPPIDDNGYPLPPEVPWIFEDYYGIHCWRHPQAIVDDDPSLTAIVVRFKSDVSRTFSHADYERLSHFQLQCWETMTAAESRHGARRDRDRDNETQETPAFTSRYVSPRQVQRY